MAHQRGAGLRRGAERALRDTVERLEGRLAAVRRELEETAREWGI